MRMVTTSHPTEDASLPMSRRERCAWVQFVSTLAVYIPYFAYVAVLISRGGLEVSSMIWPLVGAVALQIALTIVAGIVFIRPARREPKDERDRALEGRSLRAAYWVLAVAGFALLGVAPVCWGFVLVQHASPLLMLMLAGQGFLLCFVLAEAVRFGVLAMGYRRGF